MRYSLYTRRAYVAIIMAIILLMSAPVVADNTIVLQLDGAEQGQATNSDSAIITVPPSKTTSAAAPTIEAASGVLMDPVTGQVLYAKNPHVRRPNASTTKIMTAILLIENAKMDEMVTVSKNAARTPYTSINLQPGEKISVYDLLMGLMVRSANDAAVAAAEHVAGSVPEFAKMMNEKAKEIGCKNTNFVTPNGLHAKNHYSSAYDLCLMARYAFQYPVFNEVVNTRKHILSSRTKNRKDLAVYARHKFMKEYPGADGVKSGYIRQARYCYVGSATRDDWRLLAAVLRSEHSADDAGKLLDYGFENFTRYTVAKANEIVARASVEGGDKESVDLIVSENLMVTIPKTGTKIETKVTLQPLEAPVKSGDKVGTMTAVLDGKEIASVDLRTISDVQISFARKTIMFSKTWGIVLACLLVGGKYGTTVAKNTRRRRRRVSTPLRDYYRWR